MLHLIQEYYLWLKALHVISVIAWMAGMLYLPRLYAYHAGVKSGSEASEMLKVMERRLLRIIVNPAMVATLVFGASLIVAHGSAIWEENWLHAKLGAVFLLFGFHGFLARWRRDFAAGRNTRPAKFYRMVNEIPAALMAFIVIMVIVQPF